MADRLAVAWLALPELCHDGLRFAGRTTEEVVQLRRPRHPGNPQPIVLDQRRPRSGGPRGSRHGVSGSVGGRGWDSAAGLGVVSAGPRWFDTRKSHEIGRAHV